MATPRADVELVRARMKLAEEHYRRNYESR